MLLVIDKDYYIQNGFFDQKKKTHILGQNVTEPSGKNYFYG